MAGRGPQTFKKRQKEQARKEKQQDKVAKRLQRRQDKIDGVEHPDDDSDMDNLNMNPGDLLDREGEGQNDDQPPPR